MIETLKNVNKNDESLSFGISRMEDIHRKKGGVPDAPHRHDFFTVLLVLDADGRHIIDFNEYTMSGNQVYFISPGQVHQVIENKASKGYSMVFSTQFLVENNIPIDFIEDLNLFNNYGQSPPMELSSDQIESLKKHCEEMIVWNESKRKMWNQAIGSILKLFLIESNNQCAVSDQEIHQREGGEEILRKFRALVNEHYKEWHSTSAYAEKLHITPDHLNRVVKSLIGKTAKEYIQTRITTAAKRMLYFSGMTNKEIGYELGFSEPAHFSAFFKKCTGSSPSEFKKQT